MTGPAPGDGDAPTASLLCVGSVHAAGDAALRGVCVRLGLVYLCGPGIVALTSPERFPSGRFLAAIAVMMLAGAIWRTSRSTWAREQEGGHDEAERGTVLHMAVFLGVAAAAVWGFALALDEPERVAQMLSWMVSAGVAAATLGAGPGRGFVTLVVLGVTGVFASAYAGAPMADGGPPVVWAVCAVLVVGVRRGYAVTRAVQAAAESAQLEERVTRQASAARRAADRLLHDTVLATLSVLAHGGRGPDPSRLRRACADDAELLRGGLRPPERDVGPPGPPGVRRTSVARDNALVGLVDRMATLGLTVRVHGDALPGLSGVRDALLPALTQCLDNVARHAGVSAADVVVLDGQDRLSVVVVDEGRGFDPDTVAADRLGLAESVRARLSEAGGSAQVWSAPGCGTTVALWLPATTIDLTARTSPSTVSR